MVRGTHRPHSGLIEQGRISKMCGLGLSASNEVCYQSDILQLLVWHLAQKSWFYMDLSIFIRSSSSCLYPKGAQEGILHSWFVIPEKFEYEKNVYQGPSSNLGHFGKKCPKFWLNTGVCGKKINKQYNKRKGGGYDDSYNISNWHSVGSVLLNRQAIAVMDGTDF